MEVYKFGGASVKNSEAVRNLLTVLKSQKQLPSVIVVSAMDKTKNVLENVVSCYFNDRKMVNSSLQEVRKFHSSILLDLFDNDQHPVFGAVNGFFDEGIRFL